MGLKDKMVIVTARELQEHKKLQGAGDMKEGVRATTQRRPAKFAGR